MGYVMNQKNLAETRERKAARDAMIPGITPREVANEIDREIRMRLGFYARKVGEGSMSQKDADRRIAMMEIALAHFKALAEQQEMANRLL